MSMSDPLLKIRNHHSAACGDPPIIVGSTENCYVGYFENPYGDQWIVSQLESYNFSSFLIEQLSISRESYRPTRDGYDVGLTSASDTIRMIWAYLLAMLEVDRKVQTSHLGFLIFDEPRQQ